MSPIPARGLLTEARAELQAAGVDSAALEARLLLAYAIDVVPESLLAEPDQAVSPGAELRFREALGRRLNREPLFYITGEREFFGLAFYVDARALIPRPETELLVEEAIAAVSDLGDAHDKGAGLLISRCGHGFRLYRRGHGDSAYGGTIHCHGHFGRGG